MRIDKLTIKNFKGFEDETFLLNPRFTVFIGDNARGKTAILNALSVAAGSFFLGIDGVDSRTIHENEIRMFTIDGQPKPQIPVSVEASWHLSQEEQQLWRHIYGKPVMTWKREIQKSNTTSKDAKEIRAFAETLLKNSRKSSGTVFPILAFYGTGRLWAMHEKLNYLKQEEGVKMAYTYALSAKASPKEFLEWFKTQEDSVKKFEQHLEIEHLNAFKKTITQLIPDERWQDIAFDNKLNELTGIFTTDEGKKEKLKFSQLSDGFRNIVAIAGDLAYRCIQLNPHLGESVVENTPGIVLIDELDMHLHPNWQRRIVKDLKFAFPKIQFVVTTHSPFIIQSLLAEELRILDEDRLIADDPIKNSIEEIAGQEMGVAEIPRSKEFLEMQNRAKEYFDLIKAGASEQDLVMAKEKLDELRIKYSNDPAYVAFLQSELPKTI